MQTKQQKRNHIILTSQEEQHAIPCSTWYAGHICTNDRHSMLSQWTTDGWTGT